VTPLVGGLFTVGLKEASRVIAVLTLVVELALAVYVTVAYSWSGGVGPHGTVDFAHRWVVAKPLGLAADVGVDGVRPARRVDPARCSVGRAGRP
jgi:NADH:ubiquinone oxidoreductase subunit 4 (subunit M)